MGEGLGWDNYKPIHKIDDVKILACEMYLLNTDIHNEILWGVVRQSLYNYSLSLGGINGIQSDYLRNYYKYSTSVVNIISLTFEIVLLLLYYLLL